MKLISTPINDLYIVEPKVYEDYRGYFFEMYNAKKFEELGIVTKFLQDNESFSTYGVIRGLHYQLAPYAQTKLVKVIQGRILDVAVDIRKNSPTFGRHFAYELNDVSNQMLYIPQGFAHGFSVLSETAKVLYKCDDLYNAEVERGIRYNDPTLAIDWKVPHQKAVVSARDNVLPLFNNIELNLFYGGEH
jgi:dTDP-4-dehydrorhamnose 3,5-epimerase